MERVAVSLLLNHRHTLGNIEQHSDTLLRRTGVWLWSGAEPQLAWSCPQGGDWRLELRDLCMAFPEVGSPPGRGLYG